MPRRKSSNFDMLVQLPWWVAISLALAIFVTSHFIIPNIEFNSWINQGLAKGAPTVGKMFTLLFLLGGLLSAFTSWTKRKQLDQQTGIDSIRALTWKQFEELVGEAYRRQGYKVTENPGSGPDGGVDLTLKKGEKVVLVQCKHWKSRKVGVKIVRELLGVVTSSNADRGIIITCGSFTPEAKDFVLGSPIELIEGSELVTMITLAQGTSLSEPVSKSTRTPICPKCGNEMVRRIAKKGVNKGKQFWGCSSFPKCRSTMAYE